MELGRSRRTLKMSVAAGRAARWDLRGIAKQAALKDQRYRAPSSLFAPNPRARRRLGGASAISFLRRERSIMLPPPAARWVLRGIAKQAALKDQRYRAPSPSRAESSCASAEPATSVRGATQFRSAERPVRRLGGASAISFLGRERSIMLPPPAARWVLRGIAKQAALKDQRYRAPSTLLAPNPRARRRLGGASAISFLGRERSIMLPPPAARWVLRGIAKQAALKDQRYRAPSTLLAPNPRARRRLGGASAISFLGRERSIHAAAAGRALGPTGYRQTGGTERSALSCPVDLTRAESSCATPAGRRFGNFVFGARTIDHAAAAGRALGPTGYRQTGGTERSALSCPVDLARAESSCATPAGRRFGNFVFGARTIDHAAAAGRALGPTGYRQTGGTERSALSCPVILTRAESSCATGRADASDVGPRSDRRFMLPPPAARWVLRGIAKQAALKDQRYRAPSTLLTPNPAARAGWAALRQFRFWGGTIDHAAAAGRALGPTGYRQTGGTERSALSCPVDLTRAESSCATPAGRRFGNFVFGARTIDHAAAAGRALGPTGYRQTGGTERSALSCPVDLTRAESSCATPAGRRFGNFVFGARTIDHAAAAGRALGPTGYRQTGGTERSALSCPVILVRAESSCARGAPSQRRRSAERPTFRWSAERPAIRPTRSRRLGGASAISFLGRTMELGRSRRTLKMSVAAGRAARWELRGIAKQAALKDQRYRAPSSLFAPKSSCARGAPSQRRRSAERPTFRWSAERPAIRPTRSRVGALRQFVFAANDGRRLGGASAISFLGRERSICWPPAAPRAGTYGVSPNRRH